MFSSSDTCTVTPYHQVKSRRFEPQGGLIQGRFVGLPQMEATQNGVDRCRFDVLEHLASIHQA